MINIWKNFFKRFETIALVLYFLFITPVSVINGFTIGTDLPHINNLFFGYLGTIVGTLSIFMCFFVVPAIVYLRDEKQGRI